MALTTLGTHPTAPNQTTALGRSLTALHLRNGQLWPGFGDTFSNTGPIGIYRYDPAANAWTFVVTASTERVGRFRKIGAELWSTNDDPRGSFDVGFCKVDGTAAGNAIVGANVTNLLSPNASSVEVDVTPWDADAGATKSQDSAWAGDGTKSLLITRDALGITKATVAAGHRVPVTPGLLYGGLAWVNPASTRTCRLDMLWYDDAGNLISETPGPDLNATAGVAGGNRIYGNGVAPAGAAFAGFRVGQLVNSGAGDTMGFDKFSIHRWSFLEWVLGGSTTSSGNWRPVHLYDLAERVAGDLYCCGNIGVMGGAGLLRSQDGGTTWTHVVDRLGTTKRFYNLGVLGDRVYTVLGDTIAGSTVDEQYLFDVGEGCYIFDGAAVSRGPVLGGFIHPLRFGGRLVYRTTDDKLRSFDGVSVVEHRPARLHAVGATECFVVDANRLYSSADLDVWTDRGPAPANATSLAAA